MAQAHIVSSVSSVPFRRFLPHERNGPSAMFTIKDHATHDDGQQLEEHVSFGPMASLLSHEDLEVLLHAGHPEDSYYPSDAEYLPFTFALAAINE